MKVGRVNRFKFDNISEEVALGLASILCNMDRESINAYLESRGVATNILSKETVKELISLGNLINQSNRGGA